MGPIRRSNRTRQACSTWGMDVQGRGVCRECDGPSIPTRIASPCSISADAVEARLMPAIPQLI